MNVHSGPIPDKQRMCTGVGKQINQRKLQVNQRKLQVNHGKLITNIGKHTKLKVIKVNTGKKQAKIKAK